MRSRSLAYVCHPEDSCPTSFPAFLIDLTSLSSLGYAFSKWKHPLSAVQQSILQAAFAPACCIFHNCLFKQSPCISHKNIQTRRLKILKQAHKKEEQSISWHEDSYKCNYSYLEQPASKLVSLVSRLLGYLMSRSSYSDKASFFLRSASMPQ